MNGKKCDKGRKINEYGSVYEGQYKNGDEHGYGVRKDYDGYVYAGDWKDGKKHG